MTLMTTRAQLEEVQAAITAVLTNQSYRLGDRTVTRADLDALHKREEVLLRRYHDETGRRPTVVGFNLGGLGY